MADRNRRQRPARSRGLSKRSNPVQRRAAITSARARPRVTLGRVVASALVVAAALGGGVLVRDRLVAPAPGSGQGTPVVGQPAVEVASAGPEAERAEVPSAPPAVAEASPPAEQAVAEPPSPPAEQAVAEPPSPVAAPTSVGVEASAQGEVLLPTGAPPEPPVSTATEPREAATANGQPTTGGGQATSAGGQGTTTTATAQGTSGSGQATTGSAQAGQTARTGAATTPARQAGARTYTVQPRDTLKGIAARYGVSIASILAANDIPNPDSLRIGQVLTIP